MKSFFIVLITFLLITGCENLPVSSFNDGVKVAMTWQQMSNDFDKALKHYHQNITLFSKSEQKAMSNGFVAMNSARLTLRALRLEEAKGKPLALAKFFNAYGKAKSGYLSIRPILISKKNNLSETALKTLITFDKDAKQLDDWIETIAEKQKKRGVDLAEMMRFITNLANIATALKT